MNAAPLAPSIILFLIYVGVLFLPCVNRYRFAMGLAVLFVGGVVSLVLGVIIWAQFPLSGAWTVGILLGIKLFIDKHALTATHFAYFWMDNT